MASTQNAELIRDIFERFEKCLKPGDVKTFRQTKLEDVRKAIIVIQRDHESRRCLRNLSRMKKPLDALGKVGVAVDVLCQGTPYLCYIWAPIKFLLQIADEYEHSFTELIKAYVEISDNIPRLDRLQTLYQDEPAFQTIVVDLCSDILEFHAEAYRILRRGGWKRLFDRSWKSFASQFDCIIDRLRRHRDLVDKEALSFDLVEARKFRRDVQEELKRQHADRKWKLLDETLRLLCLDGVDQTQELLVAHQDEVREPSTCEWLLKHKAFGSWLEEENVSQYLWIKGKPGAGKSTLAAFVIENASIPPDSVMLYFFLPEERDNQAHDLSDVCIRALLAQLVRHNHDYSSYVHEQCANMPLRSIVRQAPAMLRHLLATTPKAYLVLDGLDQCQKETQKRFITKLDSITKSSCFCGNGDSCNVDLKILICARETNDTPAKLRRVPCITLSNSEEHAQVSRDITRYVRRQTAESCDRFEASAVDKINQLIVEKAKGMFLWAKLIASTLDEQQTFADVQSILERIPARLSGIYEVILQRIITNTSVPHRVWNILTCVAFAQKPLSIDEVCEATSLMENEDYVKPRTQFDGTIIDLCKPLIECLQDDRVLFVHSSIRTFLLQATTASFFYGKIKEETLLLGISRHLATFRAQIYQEDTVAAFQRIVRGRHVLTQYIFQNWLKHASHCLTRHDLWYAPAPSLWQALQAVLVTLSCPGPHVDQSDDNGCITPVHPAVQSLHEQLRLAFTCFQRQYSALLTNQSPFTLEQLGISEYDFGVFCAQKQNVVYFCEQADCPRAIEAFATAEAKAAHQIAHKYKFRCEHITCEYAVVGFTSEASLQKHSRLYHITMTSDDVAPMRPVSTTSASRKTGVQRSTQSPAPVSTSVEVQTHPPLSAAFRNLTNQSLTTTMTSGPLQGYQSHLLSLEEQRKKRYALLAHQGTNSNVSSPDSPLDASMVGEVPADPLPLYAFTGSTESSPTNQTVHEFLGEAEAREPGQRESSSDEELKNSSQDESSEAMHGAQEDRIEQQIRHFMEQDVLSVAEFEVYVELLK